jgi:hypothetical protein
MECSAVEKGIMDEFLIILSETAGSIDSNSK